MTQGKVIVTVAPTGGMASKAQNPNLPTQPEEIAGSVHSSWKAGAAIAALHARRPDDEATCNADIYRDINQRIRERCDIVLNNSTGGGSSGDMLVPRADGLFESSFEERLKGLDAGAEMATFDGMTFADVHGGREILVVTTPSRCEALAKRFQERGIKPEWEVFGPQHILQDVTRLIEKGYDKPPYYINMVLGADRGFQGAMPYSHDILAAMIGMLPPPQHLLRLRHRPGAASRHDAGHPARRPRPRRARGQQLLQPRQARHQRDAGRAHRADRQGAEHGAGLARRSARDARPAGSSRPRRA